MGLTVLGPSAASPLTIWFCRCCSTCYSGLYNDINKVIEAKATEGLILIITQGDAAESLRILKEGELGCDRFGNSLRIGLIGAVMLPVDPRCLVIMLFEYIHVFE